VMPFGVRDECRNEQRMALHLTEHVFSCVLKLTARRVATS
jgi:hypothetical protein